MNFLGLLIEGLSVALLSCVYILTHCSWFFKGFHALTVVTASVMLALSLGVNKGKLRPLFSMEKMLLSTRVISCLEGIIFVG